MARTPKPKDPTKQHWDMSHNPEAKPLGCNGRYGKSGSNRHYYHKTKVCERCRQSARHYERELARGQAYPRRLKPCGTPAAARRHRARKEPMDKACLIAEDRARTERKARQRQRERHAKLAA
jgi:hypothetical protein